MTGTTKEFKYPVQFRILHLWLIYVAAVLGIAVTAALRVSIAGRAVLPSDLGLAIWWTAVLALLLMAEYLVLRRIPTTIRVDDGCVVLVRFRAYATFDITDVQAVQRNARWLYSGWTKITLRSGNRVRFFFVSPEAEWHDELLRALGESQAAQRSTAPKTYAWGWERLAPTRVVTVAAPVVLLIAILDWLLPGGPSESSDALGGIVFALVFVLVVLGAGSRTPVQVEFANDRLTFLTALGQRIAVTKSDVLAVEKGLMLGRLRVPGSTGIFVKLRGKPKLHIQPFFGDYAELASRLRSLARPDREH